MISTHAPLAGRDKKTSASSVRSDLFQPTRPLRGATVGGNDCTGCQTRFQPTRPLRGATGVAFVSRNAVAISTHAPLAGRDPFCFLPFPMGWDFNPRAPCGARRVASKICDNRDTFQPTRPLRGATHICEVGVLVILISTHAPLAGRDLWPHR